MTLRSGRKFAKNSGPSGRRQNVPKQSVRGKSPPRIAENRVGSGNSNKCEVCLMTFTRMRGLVLHAEYYGAPTLPCDICGTKFADEKQLKFHVTYAHEKAKKIGQYKRQCPVCNQMINTARALHCHVYHYHSAWVEKNPNFSTSRSGNDSTGASSNTEDRQNRIQFEIVLSNIKTEACDSDVEDSRDEELILDGLDENEIDEILLALHPCKDCYVPLPRLRESQRGKTTEDSSEIEETNDSLTGVEEIGGIAHSQGYGKQIGVAITDEIPITEESIKIEPVMESAAAAVVVAEISAFPQNGKTTEDSSQLKGTNNSPTEVEEIGGVALSHDYCKQIVVAMPDGIPITEEAIKIKPLMDSEAAAVVIAETSAFPSPNITAGAAAYAETDATSGSLETPNATSPAHRDENTALESSTSKAIDKRLIASKICDKHCTNEREMQQHFRRRHTIVLDGIEFCVCGIKMLGQKERDEHFYQHSSERVDIDATHSSPKLLKMCQPLEMRHQCAVCGELFWLENCLKEHGPRCGTIRYPENERRSLTIQIRQKYENLPRSEAPFVCTVCNSGFNSSATLSQHTQKYSHPDSHACPICKTVFNGRRLLKNHVHSTHDFTGGLSYKVFCEICNQGFARNLLKRNHIMHCHPVEHSAGLSVVPLKTKPLATMSTTNTAPLTNQCNVCSLEFVSRKRLIDHMVYYKKDETIYCGICCEEFAGQYMAHHHNKKFHYSQDIQKAYTHRCFVCEDSFMYKTHLQSHMSHVHGKKFADTAGAQGMNQIHWEVNNNKTGAVERNTGIFACNTCEINFYTAAHLANHESMYSNDGNFACNQCPRRFRTATFLYDHISLNHMQCAVDNSIKCNHCNENLVNRSAWVCHVKHFHNADGNEPSEFCFENNVTSAKEFGDLEVELIPTNESIASGTTYMNIGRSTFHRRRDANRTETRRTETEPTGQSSIGTIINGADIVAVKISTNCNTCGLACSSTAELAKHTASYSNTGHYICTICDRRFARQRFYDIHKAKHFLCDPISSYVCSTCDEGFETISEMKMHEAHLHGVGRIMNGANGFPRGKSIENSSVGLKNSEKQRKEICDTDVSIIYEGPATVSCEDKCGATKGLCEGSSVVHESKNRDRHSNEINGVDGPAECATCKKVFVNKNSLTIHEKNFHSSESVAEVRLCGAGENRFYVLAGIEILPEAADVLEKNFEQYNRNLGLTNSIYRYGPSYKCEICSLCFANLDSLTIHQANVHTVSSNVSSDDGIHEEQSSMRTLKIGKKRSSDASLPNTPPKKVIIIPFSLKSSGQKTNGTQRPMPKKTAISIERVLVKEIPKPVESKSAPQVTHYRCNVCRCIFASKHLLMIHKAQGTCSKSSFQKLERDTMGGHRTDSRSHELEYSKDTTARVTEIRQCGAKIELAKKLDGSNTPIIRNQNNNKSETRLVPNDQAGSLPQTRLIKLPPGHYTIAKFLQVRPLGKTAVNSAKLKGIEKKDANLMVVAPTGEQVSGVFDPDTYRELCRQHNLVPPF